VAMACLLISSPPAEIADRVVEALADPRAHNSMRANARQTIVDEYDLRTVCLPAHLQLVGTLARQSRNLGPIPNTRLNRAMIRPYPVREPNHDAQGTASVPLAEAEALKD
jgi:hypothetical protein